METLNIPFPNKKYHIIYADPPWQYRDKKKEGRTKSGAENHYDCMSLEEIHNLPVSQIAEDNSVLFLWVTFPMLLEGITTIFAWGFQYKTLGFSWIKLNQDGTPWHGVGAYAKSNCEICLMGVKGHVGRLIKDDDNNIIETNTKDKLSVVSNYVSSVVLAPKQKHSQKPSEIRERIVKLFGDISRIELFAREETDGWDSWGNEVNMETLSYD